MLLGELIRVLPWYEFVEIKVSSGDLGKSLSSLVEKYYDMPVIRIHRDIDCLVIEVDYDNCSEFE